MRKLDDNARQGLEVGGMARYLSRNKSKNLIPHLTYTHYKENSNLLIIIRKHNKTTLKINKYRYSKFETLICPITDTQCQIWANSSIFLTSYFLIQDE